MKKSRKKYDAKFKAKVAIEALKERETLTAGIRWNAWKPGVYFLSVRMGRTRRWGKMGF